MATGSKHNVIIALGSNTEQKANIESAIRELEKVLKDMSYTKKIWTEPVGIKSDKFLNCLLKGNTTLELQELYDTLKAVEQMFGRTKEEKSRGIIRIDIDIMKFDNLLLHSDDWQRNYIKQLITELDQMK